MIFCFLGDNAETWLHTVEWLIFHGAKSVYVLTPTSTCMSRRLPLLKEYHNAQIKILSCSQPKEAANHVTEIYKMGSIDAIFILPSTNSSANFNIISAIDAVLSPKKRAYSLVCIWGTDDKHSFKSLNSLAKIYNFRWENERKFKEFLKTLDRLMELGGDINLKNDQFIQQDKLLSIKGSFFHHL